MEKKLKLYSKKPNQPKSPTDKLQNRKASPLQRIGRGAMDVGKLVGEGAAQMFGVNMVPSMRKDYGDLKKQIKGYKKGGMVKKTGIAKLHKGERVLTGKQAKKFNPKKFEATRRKVFGMGKKTY